MTCLDLTACIDACNSRRAKCQDCSSGKSCCTAVEPGTCWLQRVRARLVADRREEVQGLAQTIYSDRQAAGTAGQADGFADWVAAENAVIRKTFERQAGCTTSLLASMQVTSKHNPY